MVVKLTKPTEIEVPRVRSLGSKSATLSADEMALVEQPGGCPSRISGYIDLCNLVGGDTVIISMCVKIRAGNSWKLYHADTYNGPVIPSLIYVAQRPENHGLKVTIQQTAGSYKVVDYEFYEIP